MTIESFIQEATKTLGDANIGTARLDALILLSDITGLDRSFILAHPEYELTKSHTTKLRKLVKKRSAHIPLAYIRKVTEFYGRRFYIDQTVLEPRPESETMIELLMSVLQPVPKNVQIVDVGTGSGALAITAKLELPEAGVIGLDIDPGCLSIAQKNSRTLGAQVHFLRSNLLSNLPSFPSGSQVVLLANLPYVPNDFKVNEAAAWEPKLAIFGGPDGLDLYRQLFAELCSLQLTSTLVLTESLPFQHEALAGIAQSNGFEPKQSSDFIQVFQAVS